METQNKISQLFATAFESKRLIYRTFSKTDQDREHWYRFNAGDLVVTGLGNPMVLKDVDKISSFAQVDKIIDSNHLLSVFVCIPAENTPVDAAELAKLGQGERVTYRRDRATPIGHILLAPIQESQGHARFTSIGLAIHEKHQNQVRIGHLLGRASHPTQSKSLQLAQGLRR